jgi:hypothetical protein
MKWKDRFSLVQSGEKNEQKKPSRTIGTVRFFDAVLRLPSDSAIWDEQRAT